MTNFFTLYDWCESELPKADKNENQLHRKRILTTVRKLCDFLQRSPQFTDLNEVTVQEFADWHHGQKNARMTTNCHLKRLHYLSVIVARDGKIDQPVPFFQLNLRGHVIDRTSNRLRADNLPGSWTLAELRELFTLAAATPGFVGGIPSPLWWGGLFAVILDSGLSLTACLELAWTDVDLDAWAFKRVQGEVRLRSEGTVKILRALKSYGMTHVFPKPINNNTATALISRRLETLLFDWGLKRRSFNFFANLGSISKTIATALITNLAALLKTACQDLQQSSPANRDGLKIRGLRSVASSSAVESNSQLEIELRASMTVREYYTMWYEPVVLDKKRDSAIGTKLIYRDAVNWWDIIVGENLQLSAINDLKWQDYEAGLMGSRYRRGDDCQPRSLSDSTQTKHQRSVMAILRSASKKGLCRVPDVSIRKSQTEVKPSFTIEEARKLCQWLRQQPVKKLKVRGALRPDYVDTLRQSLGFTPRVWLAFIAIAFYTGLRSGEILRLTWDMLQTGENGDWLNVPSEIVSKTGKAERKAVHPCLLEALRDIGPLPGETIIAREIDYRFLLTCHERIQRLAGLPEERVLCPHAWRRTHASMVALTGFPAAVEAARKALNHSSSETTTGHYLSDQVQATAIGLLPRLW